MLGAWAERCAHTSALHHRYSSWATVVTYRANRTPDKPPQNAVIISVDDEALVLALMVNDEIVAIDFPGRTQWESAQNQTKSAHFLS
ncbi:MAG: hypothetical protein E6Q40_01775 [Cupriavidus sp.]|nr:MAG: hypothetical protein E6Q40_01775 [Cupriavidus sp.]